MTNYYSVIIGINQYQDKTLTPLRFAEKDSTDFYNTLTDKEIGCLVEDENTKVFTKQYFGKDATTDHIKDGICDYIQSATADDVLIIFFSGHGIPPAKSKQYFLASYDVNLSELRFDHEGVSMAWLYDRYTESRAKATIVILDCCFSGALVVQLPSFKYQTAEDNNIRYAILSSSIIGLSREDENLQNGVLTHYLINALKQDAVDPETGIVSIQTLFAHLKEKAVSRNFNLQCFDPGRSIIALTKPGANLLIFEYKEPYKKEQPEELIPHHLNGLQVHIDLLLAKYGQIDRSSIKPFVVQVLNTICEFLDAEFVCVFELINKEWKYFHGDLKIEGISIDNYVKSYASQVFGAINDPDLSHCRTQGVIFETNQGLVGSKLMVTRLSKEADKYMVVCGIVRDRVDEAIAFLCASFYKYMTSNIYKENFQEAVLVEAAILDDFRRKYGFLPLPIYQRRLSLFGKRLTDIEMWFEPIVALNINPRYIRVDSWEALARDPNTGKVPRDLLNAAELWGSGMQHKLDLHFIETAVNVYAERTLPAKSNIDYSKGIYELAVNIFPSTLMSNEFSDLLSRIVKKGIFPGEKLVLEISERKEIPTPILFQKRLAEYNNRFRISFAIDDFGVGASTVSRLADLKISYVKLDAAIAKQEHNELTIKYVQELVSERIASGKKVILEGYDRDSTLDLSILEELNLNLIQGYIIGPAQKDLMTLSDSLRSDLANKYRAKGKGKNDYSKR